MNVRRTLLSRIIGFQKSIGHVNERMQAVMLRYFCFFQYWCEFAAREWGFDELFLHVERDDIRKLYNS